MEPFEAERKIGLTKHGAYLVTVKLSRDGRLSITSVEGPKADGDCYGCGQHRVPPQDMVSYADGWDAAKLSELLAIWDRWHLNDMRAGCEHQRAIDTTRKVEVVTYGLTTSAYELRKKAREAAADAVADGVPFPEQTPMVRALMSLKDWYADRFQAPEADSPLSGCYEIKKREHRAIGWTYPAEHPEGMLTKPCEVCGYKYGSAWLREELPQSVIDWLTDAFLRAA